jgi:nicotinamidase/pyrazinamidase
MVAELQASALIVVDVQNDFCDGGALSVSRGQEVVPVLNAYAERFAAAGRPVLATRDWHPRRTRHFKEFGGVWPPHCVQGTDGAAFHPELRLPEGTPIATKGADPEEDAYSGFQGRLPDGSDLATALRKRGVRHVYVGGLATDYCVRATVLDALKEGFEATVLLDASLGVNLRPHDAEEAIQEMVDAGAGIVTLTRLTG